MISQECKECHEVCGSGVHEAIERLTKFGRLPDLVAAEVMAGSNEKAMDILRTCGCNIFVPGTMYTSLFEMARFYGVTQQYLRTVLSRNRVVSPFAGGDVVKGYFYDFLNKNKIQERYSLSRTHSDWIFCDKKTHRQYHFCHSTRGNLYSARVVLALAVMMQYGRVICQDSKGGQVYNTLMKSTYADSARVKFEERAKQRRQDKQRERAKQEKPKTPDRPAGAVLNENGMVVLTTEFFATVINSSIREGIAEFAKAMQLSGLTLENMNASSKKKPENWDRISKYYDAGILTLPEAAALAKMSEESFAKLFKGKKII